MTVPAGKVGGEASVREGHAPRRGVALQERFEARKSAVATSGFRAA